MNRWIELIEGSDGKMSSTKVTTYMAVTTLCGVLITTTVNNMEPSSEIAWILAALATGVVGINRFADVKTAQANQGPAIVTNANVQGDMNVKGKDDSA